jgi:hypothetical protein
VTVAVGTEVIIFVEFKMFTTFSFNMPFVEDSSADAVKWRKATIYKANHVRVMLLVHFVIMCVLMKGQPDTVWAHSHQGPASHSRSEADIMEGLYFYSLLVDTCGCSMEQVTAYVR